jgi:septum formation protein
MIKTEEQLAFWSDDSGIEERSAAIRKITSRKGVLSPRAKNTHRYATLVLASGSPSKIRILELLGLQFKIDPANIDEKAIKMPNAEKLVCELSLRKAQAISKRHQNSLILGADTLILDKIGHLGKPADVHDAQEMLKRLSGAVHRVVTGLTLIDTSSSNSVTKLTTTNVKFRKLSPQTIERYARTKEPLGKAGGYALQGMGGLLVQKVDGEYNNVLGLPVACFVEALSELGYELI